MGRMGLCGRDVTKLEFDNVRQIQDSSCVLNAFLLNANAWKNPHSMTDFICKKQTASVAITNKSVTQLVLGYP